MTYSHSPQFYTLNQERSIGSLPDNVKMQVHILKHCTIVLYYTHTMLMMLISIKNIVVYVPSTFKLLEGKVRIRSD